MPESPALAINFNKRKTLNGATIVTAIISLNRVASTRCFALQLRRCRRSSKRGNTRLLWFREKRLQLEPKNAYGACKYARRDVDWTFEMTVYLPRWRSTAIDSDCAWNETSATGRPTQKCAIDDPMGVALWATLVALCRVAENI